jgi:hypothetical protein
MPHRRYRSPREMEVLDLDLERIVLPQCEIGTLHPGNPED